MAKNLNIADGRRLSVNMSATDAYGEGIVFLSAFGYTPNVKAAEKDINKKSNVSFDGRYFTSEPDAYNVYTSKIPNSEYSHIVISKKDKIIKDERGRETISAFIFIDDINFYALTTDDLSAGMSIPQIMSDAVYEKLYKLSPAPILKEWIPYLIQSFSTANRLRTMSTYSQDEDKHKLSVYHLHVDVDMLINQISAGLRAGSITINGNVYTSTTMRDIAGIDGYLNNFSDILASKIRNAFRPHFIPSQDKYEPLLNDVCDYAAYHGHIALYNAQRAVVQATSNALNKKHAAFIVGEMGTGKTAMAIETIMTNAKGKRGQTIIIMCPGHIVRKWKSEVERLAPLSDAVIIESFSDLLNIEKKIKDKSRKRNLWLIISKDTAKFGYDERPAAVWTESKTKYYWMREHGAYTCPCCGKKLYYNTYEGRGRNRETISHNLTDLDFAKKNSKNEFCTNKVKYWNKEYNMWDYKECGAKLWQAFSKDVDYGNGNDASEWIKTKAGWIEKARISSALEALTNKLERAGLDKEEAAWLEALTEAADETESNVVRAPRKYPIARYIHRYMKGYIDYYVADEIHELKAGDSAQGEAFGDIASVAKNCIGLTGTLLNGYASGIYYILYRLFANEMKKEGYEYGDVDKFAREYGVVKTESAFEWENGSQGKRRGSAKTKFLPGVSPLVFTRFLLENAAFISQEDIASGLPGYKEIPVAVEMDAELASVYRTMEHDFKENKNPFAGSMRYMSQMIQALTVYPDQPFDQPPVVDPLDGEIIMDPRDLDRNTRRAKEDAYIELVKRKVEAGEKVLTYYHWTNRTNLGARLKELLTAEGINVTVMGANVKAKDRDEWIKQKVADGTQVLICNPTLVETGLDLLDFTTIIYYQVGYNLFTMRQASRRSWRLSQNHDVEVYFLYYKNTVQEKALSLMATKLQAAMAIEGKFSEEGLNAMSNNEDILTQIAASVTDGMKDTVDAQVFEQTAVASRKNEVARIGVTMAEKLKPYKHLNYRDVYLNSKKRGKKLYAANEVTTALQNNPFEIFCRDVG